MRESTDIERAKTSAELDAMKDAAKILDGLPLEVASRVAAWLFDKYLPRSMMPTLPDGQGMHTRPLLPDATLCEAVFGRSK